jgi:lipid II isoglutaminyl synthase (glutamine-hydrolysing)
MINILHLYYDLLNLYGENANTRCLVHNLELNNIKVHVDLKSINDKIDLSKYDIIYIGQGSEDNLELARTDILNRKEEFKRYIESNKLLLLTGNSMDLFGSYIEVNNEKLETLNIFDYYTKLSNSFNFKNASTDRIVGEITCKTTLIKNNIIGFQNRCDQNFNIKDSLFTIDEKYSNDGTNNQEGFTYKNVYATHIIGPLLIRNPYLTDYLLNKVCNSKKIKYKSLDVTAKEAYKKYLENFN